MPKLLTLDKVSEALGCSIYSVRRYIALGSIRAVNIARRVMVSTAEVERIQREGLPSIPLGRPRKLEGAVAAPARPSRAAQAGRTRG